MTSKKFSAWQWTTMLTLTVGYAGYYVCRSNLSVAQPLLLDAFADQGLTMESMGKIASMGTFLYASGKLFNGTLCDFVGGRRMFLFGMIASVAATILFGLGTGFTVFFVAWCINRFVQSMGWGALVKTASCWFPTHRMGSVLGFLALSYLFGDVIARIYLGQLVQWGAGWREVFFIAAATFALIWFVSLFLIKSSPADVGEEEPEANPENLFGEGGNEKRPASMLALLLPYFKSPSFWVVCVMSLGLTIIRETFNFWTPTYLTQVVELDVGHAGIASSLFPFFGGLSVLAAGALSDYTQGRRGLVMFLFLLPASGALFLLATLEAPQSPVLPLILISAVGFLTLGPYAFLSGVISVDLGGKQGCSTAAGVADAVGYFGATIVSGWGVGALAEKLGWTQAFMVLAVILAVTTLFAVAYWIIHEKLHLDVQEEA